MTKTIFGFPVVTSDDLGIELKEDSIKVVDWRKWTKDMTGADRLLYHANCLIDLDWTYSTCATEEEWLEAKKHYYSSLE